MAAKPMTSSRGSIIGHKRPPTESRSVAARYELVLMWGAAQEFQTKLLSPKHDESVCVIDVDPQSGPSQSAGHLCVIDVDPQSGPSQSAGFRDIS
ncbi:hypothetical protein J6590_094203 [Homalodisca vitripennis]|nr:hypothetical protein J6590_094203 [Homalodisca vitripennis]